MLKLKIGSRILNNDGQITTMDTTPFLKNSRTFVPIRFVAQAFGRVVEWVNDRQEVIIYPRKKYFETADDAAYDWCMYWHCYSMASAREISGGIFHCDKGYYWDKILIGQPESKEVAFSLKVLKEGDAIIHSHSTEKPKKTDGLGVSDMKIANKYKLPIYMVNSSGELYLYSPSDRKDRLIREGLPTDARHLDVSKSAEKQKEYFSTGYNSLDEYEQGYKADYYNQLHMRGLSYMKEVAVL